MTSKIVSQANAARMLGITRQAVASLINRGRLKTIEIDGVDFVYRSSVESFQKLKPGPKSAKRKKVRV
jgi:biotin operon repressor